MQISVINSLMLSHFGGAAQHDILLPKLTLFCNKKLQLFHILRGLLTLTCSYDDLQGPLYDI